MLSMSFIIAEVVPAPASKVPRWPFLNPTMPLLILPTTRPPILSFSAPLDSHDKSFGEDKERVRMVLLPLH